jgi:hypothetical protein
MQHHVFVSLVDKDKAVAYGSSFSHLNINEPKQNKTNQLSYLEITVNPPARYYLLNLSGNILLCCPFHINVIALCSCIVAGNGFTTTLLATQQVQT